MRVRCAPASRDPPASAEPFCAHHLPTATVLESRTGAASGSASMMLEQVRKTKPREKWLVQMYSWLEGK